jgi:hypothetical protein
LSNTFPIFVNLEENKELMKEVGKGELHMILQRFQKYKGPRLDGLLVEFFLGCYEFMEEDLRKVVETSMDHRKSTTFVQHNLHSVDS